MDAESALPWKSLAKLPTIMFVDYPCPTVALADPLTLKDDSS